MLIDTVPGVWVLSLLLLAGSFHLLSKVLEPRDRAVRVGVLLVYSIVYSRYLIWRLASSALSSRTWLEMLLGTTFALLEGALGLLTLRSLRGLQHWESRSAQADADAGWYGSSPPWVDVLLPTYNENQEVLFRSIASVTGLTYSKRRIWILDDGNRPWVRDLADEFAVNYFARTERSGFKGGNLNDGLKHIQELTGAPAEYIAVFDADFSPKPNFLERTLALLKDPGIALVQTPQYYLNPDPIQSAFSAQDQWPDDQRAHFHCGLPSASHAGRVTCGGTSFVIRSKALEDVGGFATEVVVEDALTSQRLMRKGWRGVYLEEHLSTGLAPEGLAEFLTQRGRWCLGTVQMAIGEHGVLRQRSSWFKPWVVLQTFRWPVGALVRAGWLALPLLYFTSGLQLLPAGNADISSYAIPVIVARGALVWMMSGTRLPFFSEIAELLLSFAVVPAALQGLRCPEQQVFRVTDKGRRREKLQVYWGVFLPLALVAAAIVIGMIVSPMGPVSVAWAAHGFGWIYAFAIYKLVVVCCAMFVALEPKQSRRLPRLKCCCSIQLRAQGVETTARILDISEQGARIALGQAHLGRETRLSLRLPGLEAIDGVIVGKYGRDRVGVRFLNVSHATRAALVRRLYSADDILSPPRAWSIRTAFPPLLRTVVGLTRRYAWLASRRQIVSPVESGDGKRIAPSP